MDEIALIKAAQHGDLDAFNRLVLAYQDLVYNQAVRMLGDEDAAADTAQETFISAHRSLHSYRGGSFRAWLLRIVTNACYDELRRRYRHPTIPLEPIDDAGEEIDSPHWMADPDAMLEEQVERAELERAIMDCLGGLPPEFRTTIVLIDIQGLDYSEAAETIGKPLGTIKSRLARGRLRLRDCLQGFWELLPAEYRLK